MADAQLPRRPALPPRARLGAHRRRRPRPSASPGSPRTRSARSSSSTRPRSARRVTKDESYAEVESVKAVSDVIAPLSGEIVEVNTALGDSPEAINEDPYGEGWMVKVKLSDRSREGQPARPRRLHSHPDLRAPALEPLHRHHRAGPRARCSPRSASSRSTSCSPAIPEGVRLGRELDLPPGQPEQDGLRAPARPRGAQRLRRGRAHVPRRGHVRPLRPGGRRHADGALGVPDAVHALPARDLPGRAAGHVRVPDRDQRADRAAGLQRLGLRGPERGGSRRLPGQAGQRPAADRRLARRAPAQPRDAAHLRARLRRRGRRGPAARRRHRRRRRGPRPSTCRPAR